MSTPVVQVSEGVVLAPLIGTRDSQRTPQVLEKVLQTIVETRSSVTLVDITSPSPNARPFPCREPPA